MFFVYIGNEILKRMIYTYPLNNLEKLFPLCVVFRVVKDLGNGSLVSSLSRWIAKPCLPHTITIRFTSDELVILASEILTKLWSLCQTD